MEIWIFSEAKLREDCLNEKWKHSATVALREARRFRSPKRRWNAHGIAAESMSGLFIYELIHKHSRRKQEVDFEMCSRRKQFLKRSINQFNRNVRRMNVARGVGEKNYSCYVMTIHASVIGWLELGFTDAIRGQSGLILHENFFLRPINKLIVTLRGFPVKTDGFFFPSAKSGNYDGKYYTIAIWVRRRNKCWKFP